MHCNIKPLTSALVKELEITATVSSDFEQGKDLTCELNKILNDHSKKSFLNELIYHTGTKGATQLYFLLDKHYHKSIRIISGDWKGLQGPALLFWVDSAYSDEDLLAVHATGFGIEQKEAEALLADSQCGFWKG